MSTLFHSKIILYIFGNLSKIYSFDLWEISKNTHHLGVPLHSWISWKFALATTSLVESSNLIGSYFFIKCSHVLLISFAHSPLIASVTSSPYFSSGYNNPVGWNCISSISHIKTPAFSASDIPSPKFSLLLDDDLQYTFVNHPVARTTSEEEIVINSSVFSSIAITHFTAHSSTIRSAT